MKEGTKREQYLREFVVSVAAGAAISAVLCATLPGIEKGLEMIVFFLALWFVCIYAVWSIIDLTDRIRHEGFYNFLFTDRRSNRDDAGVHDTCSRFGRG